VWAGWDRLDAVCFDLVVVALCTGVVAKEGVW
jgi:hypothetical protein